MNYILDASRDVVATLSSHQLIIMVSSAAAGIVAILTAGRKP